MRYFPEDMFHAYADENGARRCCNLVDLTEKEQSSPQRTTWIYLSPQFWFEQTFQNVKGVGWLNLFITVLPKFCFITPPKSLAFYYITKYTLYYALFV